MPIQRFNTQAHAHSLNFACFDRKPFLKNRIFCQFLAESINLSHHKMNFDIWAYVFMPDHVHLLIFPQNEDFSIIDILRSIKQSSSRRITNWCRENNPEYLRHLETGQMKPKRRFWQDGPGYDKNLYVRDTILEHIDYMHNNPVRKGLVEVAEDWYWSSAAFWLKGGESPVKINAELLPVT